LSLSIFFLLVNVLQTLLGTGVSEVGVAEGTSLALHTCTMRLAATMRLVGSFAGVL